MRVRDTQLPCMVDPGLPPTVGRVRSLHATCTEHATHANCSPCVNKYIAFEDICRNLIHPINCHVKSDYAHTFTKYSPIH